MTYGVDLPARPLAPIEGAATSALVVADPRGDLPAARDEAQRIAGVLRARGGLEPLVLQGREATHRAVRDAIELQQTTLLHYAGHGVFEGRDGWESGFPLAAGGWLSVGDVLVLRRAPALVLLSGCETARASSARPPRASASPRRSSWPDRAQWWPRHGRSTTPSPSA